MAGPRYMTVRKFSAESGYSEDAIRTKMRDAVWRQGEVWVKAPDGRILIDIEGFERWVAIGMESNQHLAPVSRSASNTRASAVGRGSSSSPLPLT